MEYKESWKPFPLDTRYEISTLGTVRRISTQKVRNPTIKQNGYPGLVFTYKGGKPRGWDLHTMVALTWLGPRPPKFDVSHLDGNKLNNKADNLAYESRWDNSHKPFNDFYSKHALYSRSKLTAEQVIQVRKDTRHSNMEWARRLGVERVCIWKIRTNRSWKHLLSA